MFVHRINGIQRVNIYWRRCIVTVSAHWYDSLHILHWQWSLPFFWWDEHLFFIIFPHASYICPNLRSAAPAASVCVRLRLRMRTPPRSRMPTAPRRRGRSPQAPRAPRPHPPWWQAPARPPTVALHHRPPATGLYGGLHGGVSSSENGGTRGTPIARYGWFQGKSP